nr:carbohydrate binding domain-containing protein [Paraflavitalea speifideiaquila]
MWGIFFEDINFGADGGIYAELVKNRSFEFAQPLMGWKEQKQNNAQGAVLIINRGEQLTNPRYARFKVTTASGYGITNEGFRGMGITAGNQYNFSLLARVPEGALQLRLELVNAANQSIATTTLPLAGTEWKKYTATLIPKATEAKAKLNIWFEGTGLVDADMLSLSTKHLEEQAGRPACRPGTTAGRYATWLPPFSRWMYSGRPRPGQPLPMEKDHWRYRPTGGDHESLEYRIPPQACPRLLPILWTWLL